VLTWGPFRIDLIADQVRVDGREVTDLQRSALRFLAYLVENAGRLCTREEVGHVLFRGRSLNERHSARIVSILRQRCGHAGGLIHTHIAAMATAWTPVRT
jgi:DNA-binding response OmpR family regulator